MPYCDEICLSNDRISHEEVCIKLVNHTEMSLLDTPSAIERKKTILTLQEN